MNLERASVFQSPGGHTLTLLPGATMDGDEVIEGMLSCSGTNRRYAIARGTSHLYDDEDISPILKADYGGFEAYFRDVPFTPGHDAVVLSYQRAKALQTDFLFSMFRY